jgi:hypothetical protein
VEFGSKKEGIFRLFSIKAKLKNSEAKRMRIEAK